MSHHPSLGLSLGMVYPPSWGFSHAECVFGNGGTRFQSIGPWDLGMLGMFLDFPIDVMVVSINFMGFSNKNFRPKPFN